jgi:hypothetical protein
MEYDHELHELLQDAVDEGFIETGTAAHGVTLQLIADGYSSLTPAQKWTYETHVVPHLKTIHERREVEARRSGMPD